jgi:hypothetical protein
VSTASNPAIASTSSISLAPEILEQLKEKLGSTERQLGTAEKRLQFAELKIQLLEERSASEVDQEVRCQAVKNFPQCAT